MKMIRHHGLLVACIAAVLVCSAAKGTLNDSEYIAAPRQPVKRPTPAVNGSAVPPARQHTGVPAALSPQAVAAVRPSSSITASPQPNQQTEATPVVAKQAAEARTSALVPAPGKDSKPLKTRQEVGSARERQHGGAAAQGPSEAPAGLHALTTLQAGAPEAASGAKAAPGEKQPHAVTPGQAALQELLSEAAAAPAEHSGKGEHRAPASRYASQDVVSGYYDVWPAPPPCAGYYHVRAAAEVSAEIPSPERNTTAEPRYSTQRGLLAPLAMPEGSGKLAMPAALAPISTTQLAPTYILADLPAEPSELLAPAPDTEDSLSTYRAGEPSSAVPAAGTAFHKSAADLPFSSAGEFNSGAYGGAYGPSLDARIQGLEEDLLSTVYDAGYEAGYEAGLKEAHQALLSRASVAAQPPGGAPIHQGSRQPLLPVAAPQSSQHLPQGAQAPAPQPELQSHPRSQAYARHIYSGYYGHSTPAPASAPAQSAGHAAPKSHELSPAHALPSYAVPAAYGYQAYAYTASYSPAEKELLGASAYAQAAEHLRQGTTVDRHPGAYAALPVQGPSLALEPTSSRQSFAEAPVVRSYPGEVLKARAGNASALLLRAEIAPATSDGLSAPLAYGPSPAYRAAYAAQGPSLASEYAPASAPAPAPQPALTAEPAQAPTLLIVARPSHIVPAAYAPGLAPEAEPELGAPPLPLPASVPAPAMSYGSVPAYSGASAPLSAPSPALAAYAGSPGPVPAVQPRAYAPVAAPCEVCRMPTSAAHPERAPPAAMLSVLESSQLAQYADEEGTAAYVVYFVAQAAFSRPPLHFTAEDLTVANGTVLNVLPESECGQYIIKGYVEQHKAAGANSTTVELATVAGLKDCTGKLIPAVSATGQVANRPVGWLEAPDLAGGNNGSTTAQPKVFLTLTFSQPVLSVSPADIQVNLTEATVSAPSNSTSPQAGPRRSLAEELTLCAAEPQLEGLYSHNAASKAYPFMLSLPKCFKGQVTVKYVGTAQTTRGLTSFPVKPFGFYHPKPEA